MYCELIYTRKNRRKTSRTIADAKTAIIILQNKSFEKNIVSTWGFKRIDDWASCISLSSLSVTLSAFCAKLVSGEGVSSTYLKLYKFKPRVHKNNTTYMVITK